MHLTIKRTHIWKEKQVKITQQTGKTKCSCQSRRTFIWLPSRTSISIRWTWQKLPNSLPSKERRNIYMSPHSPTPPIHPSTHHDRALYQYMCSISKPIRTPACLKTQSPFRCIGRGKIINKHGAFLFPGHKEVCMASYCPSKVCLVHFDAAPVLDVP